MTRMPSILVQLVHLQGPMAGQIQEFREPEICIGRHPSSHVQFPRELAVISRNHARILREGNRFQIIDNSTNGTFINGVSVSREFLKDGDVIMFTQGGPKISFLTKMEEGSMDVGTAPPAASPLPEESPSRISRVLPGEVPSPLNPHPSSAAPISPQPSQPQAPQPPVPPLQTVQPQPFSPRESQFQPSRPPVSQPEVPPVPSSSSPSQARVMVPLVIQYGPMLQSYKELPIILGSGGDCDFAVNHASLLPHHIQFFFSDGHYWIKDLTGQAQVRINDEPIQHQAAMNSGDKVSLTGQGPSFRFMEGGRLAEIPDEPPAAVHEDMPDTGTGKEKNKTGDRGGSLFGKWFK